jgi:hypothetical protein
MQLADLPDEGDLGGPDVLDGLAGLGLRKKVTK